MPVEIVKYGRENVCSNTLAASFGDPVLCPGPMDAAQKHARLGKRDWSSCEISVSAMAKRNGSCPANVTSYKR
jgi:hypothetical protein